MGKTIGLTYDIKSDWHVGDDEPVDANAEFDKPETIDYIEEALVSAGHIIIRLGNLNNLLEKINQLNVDLVFNICEGRWGRNRESTVPNLLEAKGVAYVGADGLTLGITLDKVLAKKLLIADGLPTPQYAVIGPDDDLTVCKKIGFPLFVKTRHEGSSKGISAASRVTNMEQLKAMVKIIHEQYHQDALVEEFVSGSEFTVAVLGNEKPEAMPVIQYCIDGKHDLGDEFYTRERLVDESVEYICPAKISNDIEEKLRDLAVKAYKSVECRDFGRVDFRINHENDIYILEINPYPSLDKNDTFDLFPEQINSTYDKEINRIVNFALERNGLLNSQEQVSLNT